MNLAFVVNHAHEVHPSQTTALLMETALARGHRVLVAGAEELDQEPGGRVRLPSRELRPGAREDLQQRLADLGHRHELSPGDAVAIRTNPGRSQRPWAHETALQFLRRARDQGVAVNNDPDGLVRAASKLYLSLLPEHVRPRTLVSRDPRALRAFVDEAPDKVVLKPLTGTQGRDVFVASRLLRDNLNQIIDVLVRDGFAIAQDYVPEAGEGDTRVLLLDGEPLRAGDQVAVVRRVPGGEDFRSNVHVGGHPAPADYSPRLQAIVQAVGPRLRLDGLTLVGLDVIGDRVVEVNAFAPGGLFDANRFCGVDFLEPIVDRLTSTHRQNL